eukprot:TRINITY_DN9092_c0_g1_i1.p2 TRINITY_DN9092_c0_g1~~TRINITY_DN9092_c0_g1_i1.p2  ORF type:complete len:104 (+),score=23.15 TRINITY_DN9092_c0_g1_i1:181-492(+)
MESKLETNVPEIDEKPAINTSIKVENPEFLMIETTLERLDDIHTKIENRRKAEEASRAEGHDFPSRDGTSAIELESSKSKKKKGAQRENEKSKTTDRQYTTIR